MEKKEVFFRYPSKNTSFFHKKYKKCIILSKFVICGYYIIFFWIMKICSKHLFYIVVKNMNLKKISQIYIVLTHNQKFTQIFLL